MDRYDAGDRVTVEELISSAESGVEVELTRDGKVVARVVPTPLAPPEAEFEVPKGSWLDELRKFRASLPPEVFKIDWQATLREVREGRGLRAYLDASTIVALVLKEPTSFELERWLFEDADERLISTYGWGEFVDAIARSVRRGSLTGAVGSMLVAHFSRQPDIWARHDTVDADVLEGASFIAADMTRGLKLGDAIHLAACRRLGATLLTGDRQQAAAASAFDIPHHLILLERT